MTAAQNAVAVPAPSAPTLSYRNLLEPVPNAVAALKADDARLSRQKDGNVQVAQYYHHHHHHHHHHGYYFGPAPRRYWYHHHHHHHGGLGVYIR